MEKQLTNDEVVKLIEQIKEGDNSAWEELCSNFEDYVHNCAWNRLKPFVTLEGERKKAMEEDLYMAGWQGFISALNNYNPKKGPFLAYAKYDINGAMSKELDFLLNPLGLTDRPVYQEEQDGKIKNKKKIIGQVSLDDVSECIPYVGGTNLSVGEAPNRGKYKPEHRVLQIMEVLRQLTDEEHSLSKDELRQRLVLYRRAKHDNGTPVESENTITSTIEKMLAELDPLEYSQENEEDYRIKYSGYKENRLKAKLVKENDKKAKEITDFSYVHTFRYAELDKMIQLICFSDMFATEEKEKLIKKLMGTTSMYYRTPFWDGVNLRFNPGGIHGRFSSRRIQDKTLFASQLKTIQEAINNLGQIRFKFNCYTADHAMIPKTSYTHILSPYHLVVYHDNYYCIGLKKDDKRIWHYRVDLMSDVEIVRDDEGKMVIAQVCAFEGLPISNACWDPEKYMSEHLNMAYDSPKDIRIKIKNTDYTILHDWFGNHYEKTNEACEEGYDIVLVKTSSSMIVHWAMQYGTNVEIMDVEIRAKIRDEVGKMREMYGEL